MNLIEIRNKLVSELHKHLKIPVVLMNQAEDKPKYPFIGYNILVPYSADPSQGIYDWKTVPSEEVEFQYDFIETVTMQPQFTMSFNGYSQDEAEAYEYTKKIWNWLIHEAYDFLLELNLVVVSQEDVLDRGILIVDNYERRCGFDVRFRTSDSIERRVRTIERSRLNA